MDPMSLACSHIEFSRSTLRSDCHGNGARVVAAAQLEPVNMAGVRSPHVCGLFVLLRERDLFVLQTGKKTLHVTCYSQRSTE